MISNSTVIAKLTSFSTAVSIPDIKTIRPRARAMHKLRCIRIGFLFLGGFLQTNQNTVQCRTDNFSLQNYSFEDRNFYDYTFYEFHEFGTFLKLFHL